MQALERFGVDWQAVGIGLYGEVEDGVRLSHGEGNAFAVEVREFGEGLGIKGRVVERKLLEEMWRVLRRIADAEL